MDFHSNEATNGVRMSWNIWPSSRLEATRNQVPLGCLFTPLKQTEGLQLVEYSPVLCACGAALNPWCSVDYYLKTWGCPFCSARNAFPQHYAEHITATTLPTELFPSCTTMEYILPRGAGSGSNPLVFLFVLDLAMVEEELEAAKESLQQSLALLPQNAVVGLITFGANAYVHEVSSQAMPRSYAFRGDKEFSAKQLAYQLGISAKKGPTLASMADAQRFLMPVSECDLALNALLGDLKSEVQAIPKRRSWRKCNTPVASMEQAELHRPQRCTSTALSVATALLEATCSQSCARVCLLVGGPCTTGPGRVVGEDLADHMRSHRDLERDTPQARHVKPALSHYAKLASRAVDSGFAVDIFACCLDQVGLHEMRPLAEKSGGYMVMSDSFSMNVFKDSFLKMFECDQYGYLKQGFNAKLEMFASRDIQCCGAIGSLASLRKRSPLVSDTELAEGGTCLWAMGSLDRNSSVAFYFDVAIAQASSVLAGKQSCLQFQTNYLHASGQRRVRVTTVACRHADVHSNNISLGFDQEVAAVLVAKYAAIKCDNEDAGDVVRWLDRMLIRMVSKFADYRRDDPTSFNLGHEMACFPQIMYHLRRSNFLRTFGTSPDETAYYRTLLVREGTLNALCMIQPALLQYSFDGQAQPVLLDSRSLKPDVMLLMDDFFHVVVWRGEKIQAWFDAGYQDQEEYANFKALLQTPAIDARQILSDRFPVPKFVQTNAGGSQARFLTSKVNPASECQEGMAMTLMTDDVSLKVFMEHLIKLVVQCN